MKRALGAVTTWDTFKKMTEGEYEEEPQLHHHDAAPVTEHHPAPIQYAEPHKHAVTNGGGHNDVNRGATQTPPKAQTTHQTK